LNACFLKESSTKVKGQRATAKYFHRRGRRGSDFKRLKTANKGGQRFFAIKRVLPMVPRMRLSCMFCTMFPVRRSVDRGHSMRIAWGQAFLIAEKIFTAENAEIAEIYF